MDFIRKYLVLAVALALLATAGSMVTPLHRAQIRKDLTSDPVRGVGPDIVLLTTALGGFRGIIINVIWIRMESLKQEGKFFEIAQLAELASKLAPRFPKVWDFNAWNLAYNIVPSIPEHNERWPWVQKGIELLRDQGIPNNPEEPELYFSLAWIFMHKIGGDSDNAHWYYKQYLGLQMHEAFDGRGSRETLEALARAPRRKETLLRNDEVRRFYQRLLESGFDPFRIEDGEMRFFAYVRSPQTIPEPAGKLMQAEENRALVREISTFARAHRVRNELKMRPELMLELMDEYGPLDWRNPFAHAIYWATLGRHVAAAYRDRSRLRRMRAAGMSMEEIIAADSADWDEAGEWMHHRYKDIHYDRVVYNSLATLVTQGRFLFDSRGGLLPMLGPDYRFTEPMLATFERMMEKYDVDAGEMQGVGAAYENFLRRAVFEFYYMGAVSDSRRYYEKLGERFPDETYEIEHEQFVLASLEDYVSNARTADVRSLVRGLLNQSYFFLAADAPERAGALQERARRLAQRWNSRHARDEESRLRAGINYDDIRESALIDIFAGHAGFSDDLVDTLRRRLPRETVERIERAVEDPDDERDLRPFFEFEDDEEDFGGVGDDEFEDDPFFR